MLNQYPCEPLKRSEQSTVQHDRTMTLAIFANISRVETLWQREINLQRSALPISANRIAKHEFKLRAIKRPLAWIDAVWQACRLERVHERGLRLVPNIIIADAGFWPVREFDAHVLEPEILVDIEHQIDDFQTLILKLIWRTENVGIILCEMTHAHHAMQGPGRLIAVHLAELCHT